MSNIEHWTEQKAIDRLRDAFEDGAARQPTPGGRISVA